MIQNMNKYMNKLPKYNPRVLNQWKRNFDEACVGMDTLEDYIRDNIEAIQATPMRIILVLRRATILLKMFSDDPATLERRTKWTEILRTIYSKQKEELRVQAERELARTEKRTAKYMNEIAEEDVEAGAPEPKPKFDGRSGRDTKVTTPLPNKKKQNEKNNGAKTNKKK